MSQCQTGPTLIHVHHETGQALAWISVGLAVLTSFLQGLVTAIALMTEASNRWTFRFRLALIEHWWWTLVSNLLLASLVMTGISYLSGTGAEPISVLALSATTFLAIVRYTMPAWQERHYTWTRWLAWTGDSRTGIPKEQASFCGGAKRWRRLLRDNKAKLNEVRRTPSDMYGWRLWRTTGIKYDPTDILNLVNAEKSGLLDEEDPARQVGLYANSDPSNAKMSLRWGRDQGFRRRVSRAISSMPLGLLKSYPITVDGYDGRGLATAMGILGRNKGLRPADLVFKMDRDISTHMENFSTWSPRPAKVLRSFYQQTMATQYGKISEDTNDFVSAAVELALLMADMPHWAIDKWLQDGLEHQSLKTNHDLANKYLSRATPQERWDALDAHYHSSYVSMIVSLNNMDIRMQNRFEKANVLDRPDLLCLGLLLKARGKAKPSWWDNEDVRSHRVAQTRFLGQESHWKMPMARLLGLETFPPGFELVNSQWGDEVATTEQVVVSGQDLNKAS